VAVANVVKEGGFRNVPVWSRVFSGDPEAVNELSVRVPANPGGSSGYPLPLAAAAVGVGVSRMGEPASTFSHT
jgi:hypothetical protein